MRRILYCIIAATWILAGSIEPASARPNIAPCTFQGGFRSLHDLIPDIVGDCRENEHHDATTGDALQATANGLLAWRKADNWTAFTNGSTTWINGPCGLQSRANEDRFAWEQGGNCMPGSSPAGGSGNPPPPPVGSRDNPVPVGAPVTLTGDWQLRVLGTAADATRVVLNENQFNDPPAPGRQFFVARVSATYMGSGSDRFDGAYRLRAVGAASVSYATFQDSCGVIPDELGDPVTFTGGTITGNLCWSIRSSDAPSLVMYDAAASSEPDGVFISLH